MRKQLIALALALVFSAVMIACGSSGSTTGYAEPTTEDTTATETASEFTDETVSQTAESETSTPAESTVSFSAGTTTRTYAESTARPATAAQPAVTQATTRTAATTTARPVTAATTNTTTTRHIPPTTTTTTLQLDRGAQDIVPMDMAYLNEVVAELNRIRAERGLAPMVMNPALMASTLTHAKKMAEAGTSFHSELSTGFESVGHVPHHVFTAQMLGEDMTTHVSNFTQDGYFSVGIAVVKRGDYLYAVMQGDR